MKGPIDKPAYTAAIWNPRAFPLSLTGYTEDIIAIAVPASIAPPIPWTTLEAMRKGAEGDMAISRHEIVKIIMP
jgi:hypothetical protein